MYGLGGVSMTTSVPHEAVYLVADGEDFELFYLQQPGGGALDFYDNGSGGANFDRRRRGSGILPLRNGARGASAGSLKPRNRTGSIFGWVAENPTGVTYEPLGINGAQASIVMDWNDALLESNVARRNPSLIVLAYGTNEAGRKDWTLESYRDMFSKLIERFRPAAPTATIFVIGPRIDTSIRGRVGTPWTGIDMIVEAQRQAAASEGCAFWDMRAKMGGKGSMQQWVLRHGTGGSRAFHRSWVSHAGGRDLSRPDESVRSISQGARRGRGRRGCARDGPLILGRSLDITCANVVHLQCSP